MDDGEALRVRGLAPRRLCDVADAGDETAVVELDQVVDLHLDRPDEVNEALHALERGVAPPEDAGVRPARPLSIDAVLSPELLDHRRRPGLVPDLVGAAHLGGIVLRHRLTSIRRAGGRVHGG